MKKELIILKVSKCDLWKNWTWMSALLSGFEASWAEEPRLTGQLRLFGTGSGSDVAWHCEATCIYKIGQRGSDGVNLLLQRRHWTWSSANRLSELMVVYVATTLNQRLPNFIHKQTFRLEFFRASDALKSVSDCTQFYGMLLHIVSFYHSFHHFWCFYIWWRVDRPGENILLYLCQTFECLKVIKLRKIIFIYHHHNNRDVCFLAATN